MDLGTSVGILIVVLFLAFLVETLVEFVFGTVFDKIPALSQYKWTIQFIAIAVGVIGTFHYDIDLIAILGQTVHANPPIEVGWLGKTLTGIAIGKGSNYVHQLISKYFPAKK